MLYDVVLECRNYNLFSTLVYKNTLTIVIMNDNNCNTLDLVNLDACVARR